MPLILAGMKLTPARLNNISPGWRTEVTVDQPNTANNNTPLFNVTELVMAVDSGTVYRFHLYLKYTATIVANFRMGLTGPSGASLNDWMFFATNPTSGQPSGGAVSGLNAKGTGTPAVFVGIGTITTGGSSGNIQVQAAKNTAEASTLTIVKGSYMELEEIV
ncbi:MAG TPA: hypothetical protein VIP77_16150 [Jiangellaceae bacterium]